MKNTFTLITFCLLFHFSVAQDVAKKETAISSFSFSFQQELNLAMGLGKDDGNKITSENRGTLLFDDIKVSDNTDDEIEKKRQELTDKSFSILMKRLKTETDLKILPLETLQSKLRFLPNGYPLQNGFKKAAKVSDYEQFLNINIQVNIETQTTGTTTEENLVVDTREDIRTAHYDNNNIKIFWKANVTATSKRDIFKPIVTVTLKFGGSNGKKTAKYKGVFKSQDKIVSSTKTYSSESMSSATNMESDKMAYYDLLNKAIDNLVQQMK